MLSLARAPSRLSATQSLPGFSGCNEVGRKCNGGKQDADCRNRSMRIGLVSYEYPPQSGFGGVGTYVYRLAGALGRAGHEVVVLAGPTDVGREWPQENVTLHRIEAYYDPPRIPGLRLQWWRWMAEDLDRF